MALLFIRGIGLGHGLDDATCLSVALYFGTPIAGPSLRCSFSTRTPVERRLVAVAEVRQVE